MTTNNMGFISKMFVVGITFLLIKLIGKYNNLDFIYLIFICINFIRFIYIRNNIKIEE